MLLKNRVKKPYIGEDGTEYPGVTTVIGIMDKPALKDWIWNLGVKGIPWRKGSEGALNVGTISHYLSECFVTNREPELDPEFPPAIVEKATALCGLFKGYWEDSFAELVHSEIPLIDEMNGFGGTLDLIVKTPNGLELWDIKTSDKIWPEYYVQLSAYKWLAKLKLGMDLSPRIILITKSEKLSAPDIQPNIISKAYDVWENLVRVYHNMNQMKGMLN